MPYKIVKFHYPVSYFFLTRHVRSEKVIHKDKATFFKPRQVLKMDRKADVRFTGNWPSNPEKVRSSETTHDSWPIFWQRLSKLRSVKTLHSGKF
jgi:hypothetical protein